jgi:hypothetical protein
MMTFFQTLRRIGTVNHHTSDSLGFLVRCPGETRRQPGGIFGEVGLGRVTSVPQRYWLGSRGP